MSKDQKVEAPQAQSKKPAFRNISGHRLDLTIDGRPRPVLAGAILRVDKNDLRQLEAYSSELLRLEDGA